MFKVPRVRSTPPCVTSSPSRVRGRNRYENGTFHTIGRASTLNPGRNPRVRLRNGIFPDRCLIETNATKIKENVTRIVLIAEYLHTHTRELNAVNYAKNVVENDGGKHLKTNEII